MNKEKDFFKTCFNTVAGLEVRNESQAIAKEVVLSKIENLQQENKQLKDVIDKAIKIIEDTYYSKNTTDIDSIVSSSDKLIKVRKILKEVE